MKKIFLILTVLVSFNAFSKAKIVDFKECSGSKNSDLFYSLQMCINEYLYKGYEIIGTRSSKAVGGIYVDLAFIERK